MHRSQMVLFSDQATLRFYADSKATGCHTAKDTLERFSTSILEPSLQSVSAVWFSYMDGFSGDSNQYKEFSLE